MLVSSRSAVDETLRAKMLPFVEKGAPKRKHKDYLRERQAERSHVRLAPRSEGVENDEVQIHKGKDMARKLPCRLHRVGQHFGHGRLLNSGSSVHHRREDS